jgi:hypothetical protein
MRHHAGCIDNTRPVRSDSSSSVVPWMNSPLRTIAIAAGSIALLATCHRQGGEPADASFSARATFTRSEYVAARRLDLQRLYGICEGGQPSACQFRRIDVAALGPGRRVLLGQAGAAVQEFDSMGRWIGPVGRLGAGPGESRVVMAAGYDSAGGVVLVDQAAFRVVGFDSLRRPAGSWSMSPSAELTAISAKGGHVVEWLVPGAQRLGEPVTGSFVLIDSAGQRRGLAQVATKALRASASDLMPIQPFFTALPVWDIGPRLSVVHAPGDRMRIERYRENGRADLLVEGDAPLRPVTSSDIAHRMEGQRAPPVGGGQWAAQMQEAARNAARFHPAITRLAVLGDGSIWATESPAPDGDSARVDVFSAEGRLIGYVVLPVAARVIDGDGRIVLVTTIDSSGAPLAVVYRR